MNYKQARFIIECTLFSLEHNYFSFLEEFYLQTQGTAMGANYDCYENLTMDYWEDMYIWKNNPFSEHQVLYGRYIFL